MPYVPLDTVQATDPGDILTAAWCDTVHENFEFIDNPPTCSVYASTGTSLSINNAHLLEADSENFDTDAMHSTSTNKSRITAQTPGRYIAIASVVFAASASGNRQVEFWVNGATTGGGVLVDAVGTSSNSTALSLSRMFALAAGDYVEVRATQRALANLVITLTSFELHYLTG